MPMDTRERIAEWQRRPRAERLARLAATPAELAAAITTTPAPVEVVCHLRDLEESFHDRLTAILATDEPRFATTNPNRWAEDRQYLRHDAHDAVRAFVRRRTETLMLLRGLAADAWSRAGWQLDSRGRRTVDEFLTLMAWHDENHLAQLARALVGRA